MTELRGIIKKENIVLSIIERIEARLEKKENISVNEVAEISGFTKRYTQKIFKEETSMNISSYLSLVDILYLSLSSLPLYSLLKE